MAFAVFLAAVVLYVAFLIWCFVPLRRLPGVEFLGWLRVVLGSLLLTANISPIFPFLVLLPVFAVSPALSETIIPITMFVRTVPIYVSNVLAHADASVTAVEIEFPLTIAGTRYRPRLEVVCAQRKMIGTDKIAEVISFDKYPTTVGSDLIAKAGNATVVIGPPNNICSPTADTRLQAGPYPQFRAGFGVGPSVFVLRGDADKTKFYELRFDGQPAMADDLVLDQPRIVSVTQRPASEAVPLSALWPMAWGGEMSHRTPAFAWRYMRLEAGINACVEFIRADMDFKTQTMTSRRNRMTDLRDVAPQDRPDYCRRELARRIPQTDAVALTPSKD